MDTDTSPVPENPLMVDTSLTSEEVRQEEKSRSIIHPDTSDLSRPSIAKRRHFSLGLLPTSPSPSLNEGSIPPIPNAPTKFRKPSISQRKAAEQDNAGKSHPLLHPAPCRGRLYMGTASSSPQPNRLFYNLDQNVYVEKCAQGKLEDRALQISLWNTNSINKLQRAAARYSVVLNFDALCQIEAATDDIMKALSLIDDSNFYGFALSLGGMLFLTVEPNRCHVSLRKWYRPAPTKEDPEADLKPGRDGLILNYEQFNNFVLFMQDELLQECPAFAMHIFSCHRSDHNQHSCTICNVKGMLQMQREYTRHIEFLGKICLYFFKYIFIMHFLFCN